MFNYDWFHGEPFQHQQEEARCRCAEKHFPEVAPKDRKKNKKVQSFINDLEVRCLIYLRDGFSYEIRQIAEVATKSHLVFECEPVDQQYKVGSFVVTVPFDEIVRVEVFAVHPGEKPDDFPQITGFRAHPEAIDTKHPEAPPVNPSR